jgi:hypothetical protein
MEKCCLHAKGEPKRGARLWAVKVRSNRLVALTLGVCRALDSRTTEMTAADAGATLLTIAEGGVDRAPQRRPICVFGRRSPVGI